VPLLEIGPGRLEYELVGDRRPARPTLVMLHEGLGSISLWRNFPEALAVRTQCQVVVYSRHGYGNSANLRAPRAVCYMHDEALVVLPELLDRLGVENPVLFGHSDGGSIALIHAGGSARPVRGVIALAPHVFVEDLSIRSIAAAKITYETTNLRDRLQRHHADVDGAFRGWNDIWLHPEFRSWNIEEYLPSISCPVLVIQGEDDEFGTMEQMQRIARSAANVELESLADCGHSPYRDQPERVLQAVLRWMKRHLGIEAGEQLFP
jgi:pimeloyl-ACP methyl ester carboxylesterase